MSENEGTEIPEDPRDAAIGNTEPAESPEIDGAGSEAAGERAQAPDGAESEEYPGPSEDAAKE